MENEKRNPGRLLPLAVFLCRWLLVVVVTVPRDCVCVCVCVFVRLVFVPVILATVPLGKGRRVPHLAVHAAAVYFYIHTSGTNRGHTREGVSKTLERFFSCCSCFFFPAVLALIFLVVAGVVVGGGSGGGGGGKCLHRPSMYLLIWCLVFMLLPPRLSARL